jgi:hypothetical protein
MGRESAEKEYERVLREKEMVRRKEMVKRKEMVRRKEASGEVVGTRGSDGVNTANKLKSL